MKFILIGGGQVTAVEGKIHLVKANEFIQNYGYNLLFLSVASNDAEGYITAVRTEFSTLNFKVLKSSQEEYAKIFFDWADIIYLGGGSTEKLLDFLKKIRFKEILKEKHLVVGFSAGAIAVCDEGYSLDKEKIFKGFGLLNYSVIPHYEKSAKVPDLKNCLYLKNGESMVINSNNEIEEKIVE